MSHYGSLSNNPGAPFPRGGPPPVFRPAFSRAGPLPFHAPPFPPRGPASLLYPSRTGPPTTSFLDRRGGPVPLGVAARPLVASTASTALSLPPGWTAHQTPHGVPYYYHAGTGVSTYDRPPSPSLSTPETSPWLEYKDDGTGASYYFNPVTKETVWDPPEPVRMRQAREQVAKMTSATHERAETAASPPLAAPCEPDATQSMENTPPRGPEPLPRPDAPETARTKRKDELERTQAHAFDAMPLRERRAAFHAFLEAHAVPATLKWSDLQRLIAKDPALQTDPRWKFALPSVGDKKQAFAEYCTHARNRATIEKRRVVKKRREEFMALLGLFESSLVRASRRHGRIGWDDVSSSADFYAMRQDARWAAIADERERQQLLTTFLQEVERQEKARRATQRSAIHAAFQALLEQHVQSKELELETASSKRLDSETKRRVLHLVEEIEWPANSGNKLGDDAFKMVDRQDVYEWTETFMDTYREREHAKKKRERVLREQQHDLKRQALMDRLQALAEADKLTAGCTWDEFSTVYLSEARDEQVKQCKSDKDDDEPDDDEQDDDDDVRNLLHWRTQRRLFEKVRRRLRRQLDVAADVIRRHIDRGGDAALRVTESTSYGAFVEALATGVGIALENKAPEEGEEATREERDRRAPKQAELEAVLEATVQAQGEQPPTLAFPPVVRQVYDMWVAMAKERKRGDKRSKHRKRRRKDSRESELEDERPCRARRPSMTEDPGDESHKKRSHRSSKKRRRALSSLSCSRSRSVVRRDGSSHRRSRRSHHHSRDRDTGLPRCTNDAPSNKEPFSPVQRSSPSKALSAAEEAAKAEEIIRQARLKLETQGPSSHAHESELEEGEEVEDGEV
ncbi:hypothetical protein PsorP6_012687 [Peronosclerospora sorghi]|uniref:Uncharacterized protein n=1 Tax=Peronosclerospora sorghi TaxID=230839 RepID=A0ACC0WH68_9STRA|nr:hypothetical protein PsorP6_012687 [Peronosclerospora sorghi]